MTISAPADAPNVKATLSKPKPKISRATKKKNSSEDNTRSVKNLKPSRKKVIIKLAFRTGPKRVIRHNRRNLRFEDGL